MSLRKSLFAAALTALLLVGCCPPAVSGASPPDVADSEQSDLVAVQGASYEQRFESAWRLVNERYWDLDSLSVDWELVGDRYRERLTEVDSDDDLYDVLEEMYDEIGDDHSVYVRPSRVDEIRDQYGDLPCLAVFGVGASAPTDMRWAGGAMGAGLLRLQTPDDLVTDAIANVGFGMTEAGGTAVGYVRIPDLASDGVADGVRRAVERLDRTGAEALVLDLRGNPGGRLVSMMQVAGVFTRGFLWRAVLSWTLPMPYPAIGEPATDLPLYVLVDGKVNSAAEGLAGALQDAGRATVVGETTAGNVEAVLPFCLRDGSQAWIATGVLAPLLGATWEGRGVEPDVAVAAEEALSAALELAGQR